jgi:diacylglycerol kinase (ATP)
VDAGLLNDRYFVNVSAGGFIAEVSHAVTPAMKTVAGKLAYLIGGAQVLLDFEPVGLHFEFGDGRMEAADLAIELFAVCNARMAGGGRLLAPTATIDDGLLDVCIVRDMPALDFVALLRRVAAGEHTSDERVLYFQVRELRLEFDRVIKVNTDGQVLSAARCLYRVQPRALRFIAGPAPFTEHAWSRRSVS